MAITPEDERREADVRSDLLGQSPQMRAVVRIIDGERAENERLTGRVAEMERQLAELQEIATERHALIAGPMARSSKLVGERYDAMKVTATRALAVLDRLAWLAAEEDLWFGNENDIAVQRAAAERHRAARKASVGRA